MPFCHCDDRDIEVEARNGVSHEIIKSSGSVLKFGNYVTQINPLIKLTQAE